MDTQREITKDREIIHHIEGLLPTIDEAMLHARTQLDLLKIEDANALLHDSTQAIKSVSAKLLLFPIGENEALVGSIKDLKEAIVYMGDACDQRKIARMRETLEQRLFPAYEQWRKEVLTALSGDDFRYLQN